MLTPNPPKVQFPTHYPNPTLSHRLCHTSCALLDAGPLQSYLLTISTWLSTHPHEVLTLMLGNDARVPATTYIPAFTNAGLLPYMYIPPTRNLTLAQWPTLGEMIRRGGGWSLC